MYKLPVHRAPKGSSGGGAVVAVPGGPVIPPTPTPDAGIRMPPIACIP